MFKRLRTIARPFLASPEQRALDAAAVLHLPVIETTQEATMSIVIQNAARGVLEQHDFAEFRNAWSQAFASKNEIPSGRYWYADIEDAVAKVFDLDREAPEDMEFRLPDFERAWDDDPEDPVFAAILGELLVNIGYAWRGEDIAANVSREGWEKLIGYARRSHEVFERAAAKGRDCPYWNRARVRIGLADCSRAGELQARFERAVAFDVNDVDIYLTRAWQLMPRWHGSYEELDDFARNASIRTRQKRGLSMYARIYVSLSEMEHLPHTDADWNELQASFDDWGHASARQFVWNAYANAAMLYDDEERLQQIFRDHVREYVPGAWSDPGVAASAMERFT